MADISLIGEAFAGCQVNGGIVQFPMQLSPDDLDFIYKRFSVDLLNCNIPHYRVIGIWHDWDDKHKKSVFRCNDIYGCSLIELSMRLRYLVPMEIGGNNPDDGCFYGVNEEVKNLKEFDNAFGPDNGKGYDKRTTNILMRPSTEIGSIMIDSFYGEEDIEVTQITTSNCWYTKYSLVEDLQFPRVLVPNKFISELHEEGMGNACTFMFIKRGTGRLSFTDTQKFFRRDIEKVMPCDTIYDLSTFFTCRTPNSGDTFLSLVYLEEIDEVVLQNILNNYGRDLVANEC